MRIILLAILLLAGAVALGTHAIAARAPASFVAAQSILATSSSPGNAYVAGVSVVLTAPVEGDFAAFGGSIIAAAPITGDNLLFAGSIRSRASVGGDVRALGGTIKIDEPVKGDIVAFGYTVEDSGRAGGSVFVAGANTSITNGAVGPVTIYGNNIFLAGDFLHDVTIFASGRVTLAASTTISGVLSYEAPEPATIPSSARVAGGIQYTNASYLPDIGTSRILLLLNIGFFLFVRVLGALLLAGLLAGLFPRLAERVVDRAYAPRKRSILLTMLLGFAIFVATPIFSVLLLLTFVGSGLAILLGIVYMLLMLLSMLYAGILLGGIFARSYARRDTVLWRDGALGMLALSLITLIPVVGAVIVFLLMLFVAGALLQISFHFAFSGEGQTTELL